MTKSVFRVSDQAIIKADDSATETGKNSEISPESNFDTILSNK